MKSIFQYVMVLQQLTKEKVNLHKSTRTKTFNGNLIWRGIIFILIIAIMVVSVYIFIKQKNINFENINDSVSYKGIETSISKTSEGPVAARVNGEDITVEYINRLYMRLSVESRSQEVKNELLNQTINDLLQLQEAKRLGVMVTDREVTENIAVNLQESNMTNEDFNALLSSKNISFEEAFQDFKRRLIISKLINQTVLSNIEVSDYEIQTYFDNNIANRTQLTLSQTKSRIREILYMDKSLAAVNSYLAQLRNKASIEIFELNDSSKDLCMDIKIELLEVDNQPQVTFGSSGSQGFIEFTVDNVGLKRVERIRVSVLAEKGTYGVDVSEGVDPALQIKRRVPYDYNTYGQISQITWTPMVYKDNEPVTCSSGATRYTP